LLRFRIQPTAQCETLRVPSLPRNIPSIDSNGRGPKEPELTCHSFISDKDFLDFRHYTFYGQDIFDHSHRRGMRRAFRHIKDFDFHFPDSAF
jgi:hypothetical protein